MLPPLSHHDASTLPVILAPLSTLPAHAPYWDAAPSSDPSARSRFWAHLDVEPGPGEEAERRVPPGCCPQWHQPFQPLQAQPELGAPGMGAHSWISFPNDILTPLVWKNGVVEAKPDQEPSQPPRASKSCSQAKGCLGKTSWINPAGISGCWDDPRQQDANDLRILGENIHFWSFSSQKGSISGVLFGSC